MQQEKLRRELEKEREKRRKEKKKQKKEKTKLERRLKTLKREGKEHCKRIKIRSNKEEEIVDFLKDNLRVKAEVKSVWKSQRKQRVSSIRKLGEERGNRKEKVSKKRNIYKK